MKAKATLFLSVFTLFLNAQNPASWEHYVQDRAQYPVVSPLDGSMLTPFVGLQVDAELYRNRRRGFILQKAGFRKDEKTDETRCFEALFSDGTISYRANEEVVQNRYKIAVELLVFDVRAPKKPTAVYPAVFYNISFDQERGLYRCQIPFSGKLDGTMAFVLLAKPPYLQAELSAYRNISDQTYWDGPWVENPGEPVFIYPKSAPSKEIQGQRSSKTKQLLPGQVFNDYGFPVPATHYEWSKKGSNYARAYEANGKKGMKAEDGTILISAQYDDLHFAFCGFMIASKNGKTGVINEANDLVIPFSYKRLELLYRDQVSQVPQGVPLEDLRLLAWKEDELVGIIDGQGRILSPFRKCRNPEVVYFYEAPRHENLGIILSYPLDYQKIMKETAIILGAGDSLGIVSANGDLLLPFEYPRIEHIIRVYPNPAWVMVQKGEDFGLYDLHGCWLIRPRFKGGIGLLNNLNPEKKASYPTLLIAQKEVQVEGEGYSVTRSGLIDSLGNTILPFEYDGFGKSFMYKGVRHFWAQKSGRWGVVDINNQQIIPFQHREIVKEYDCGGAPCFSMKDSLNKFYGLLSIENQWLLPFQYKYLADGNGKCVVFLNEAFQNGLVNLRNEIVLEPKYANISLLAHGYFYVQVAGGAGGVANPDGKIVVEPTYRGMYDEQNFPAYRTFFEKQGIQESDVVVLLTTGDAVFAYLKDGRLLLL